MSSLLLCFDAGILTALHWVCLLVKGRTLCVVLLKESLHKLSLSLNLNMTRPVVSTRPGSAAVSLLSSMCRAHCGGRYKPELFTCPPPAAVPRFWASEVKSIFLRRFPSIRKEESCRVAFLTWLSPDAVLSTRRPLSAAFPLQWLLHADFPLLLSFCGQQFPNQISVFVCRTAFILSVKCSQL